MPPLYLVVGVLVVQRLVEMRFSRRNHHAMLARGGIEVPQWEYSATIVLHVAWLLAMLVFIDPAAPLSVPLLAVFLLLQCGRAWVIASLGRRWTVRLVVLPGAERVRTGLYRFANHPNYLIVCAETAVVPLMFGAWRVAVVATALYILILRTRVPTENRALDDTYGPLGNADRTRRAASS